MYFWVAVSTAFAALLYLTALLFAVRAAQTARTPQGAVGWVVFLLATPFFGVPLYLFLGHHRFHGYRIARRDSEQVVAGLRDFAAEHAPDPKLLQMNIAPFEEIANMPAARGNGADLLIDGEETFQAILAAIDDAEDYILFQFYIVRDDALGQAVQDHLIAASLRGVTVRFITDAVGSYYLPQSYYRDMAEAGIHVANLSQRRGPRHRFQLNYRNHRKSLIVDGRTGFIGGHNIGVEYLGQDERYGRWRDTHVRMCGPVVQQLQLIFVEDWHWATGEEILTELTWTITPDPADMDALIVATGPGDSTETGSMMFFSAIQAAQERIWIASPYFVPDIDILSALKNAAMRGVDVRILVPDVIDHRTPWLAAFAYFDDICATGVKIYRYTDGFMHQKVFLVDDCLAAVGTTNLDNRSFRLNFEAMALFFDPRAAAAVHDMLRADFEDSYLLTKTLDLQPMHVRLGAPIARLFSPIL